MKKLLLITLVMFVGLMIVGCAATVEPGGYHKIMKVGYAADPVTICMDAGSDAIEFPFEVFTDKGKFLAKADSASIFADNYGTCWNFNIITENPCNDEIGQGAIYSAQQAEQGCCEGQECTINHKVLGKPKPKPAKEEAVEEQPQEEEEKEEFNLDFDNSTGDDFWDLKVD